MAKRVRQCKAADEELEAAESKLQQARAKKAELDAKRAEAETELEEVRKQLGKPKAAVPRGDLSLAQVLEGQQDYFKAMPPQVRQEFGLGDEKLEQLQGLLAAAVAAERRVAEKAAEAASANHWESFWMVPGTSGEPQWTPKGPLKALQNT